MQYIVGANCFAPKIYRIAFAVRKKSQRKPSGEKLFSDGFSLCTIVIICRYIVSSLDVQANSTEREIRIRKFHFTGR